MKRPPVVHWSVNGRFLTQPQTGVQRYAGEMVRAIDTWLARDESRARAMAWDLIVPADCTASPSFEVIGVRKSPLGRGQIWEQTVLPAAASGGILNLANLGPLAHPRQIVCLHDANVYLEPTSYSRAFRAFYRLMFPLLGRRAGSITTVSNFSADMLTGFGVTRRRRASVIPNGHEHALRWNARASRFSAPDAFARPFVFALGSRARHKQIDLLLGLAPALDALGLDLVLSGGTASIFTGTQGGSAPNVRHLGFVGDDDLAALFSRALCFAFPSRTEGFGLPLLEAMVHGAPILAAKCASMPEVCGEAALYAPPDRPEAWLAAIQRFAADDDLRADLRDKGRVRYLRFSWAAGAEAYVTLAQTLTAGWSKRRDEAMLSVRSAAG